MKHITFLVIFLVIILIYADGVGSKNRLLRVFSVLSSLPLEIIVFFLLRLGSLLFNDCCNALPHSLISLVVVVENIVQRIFLVVD